MIGVFRVLQDLNYASPSLTRSTSLTDSSGIAGTSNLYRGNSTMDRKKDALEETILYLSALKGSSSRAWKAVESIWAGTYLHVGLKIPPTKELSQPRVMRVLQH